MTKNQELIFKELRNIQEYAVSVTLIRSKKYEDDIESMLNDITFETICRIMELLDGYYNNDLRGEIIDVQSGKSISSEIELHDCCVDYLISSDII